MTTDIELAKRWAREYEVGQLMRPKMSFRYMAKKYGVSKNRIERAIKKIVDVKLLKKPKEIIDWNRKPIKYGYIHVLSQNKEEINKIKNRMIESYGVPIGNIVVEDSTDDIYKKDITVHGLVKAYETSKSASCWSVSIDVRNKKKLFSLVYDIMENNDELYFLEWKQLSMNFRILAEIEEDCEFKRKELFSMDGIPFILGAMNVTINFTKYNSDED